MPSLPPRNLGGRFSRGVVDRAVRGIGMLPSLSRCGVSRRFAARVSDEDLLASDCIGSAYDSDSSNGGSEFPSQSTIPEPSPFNDPNYETYKRGQQFIIIDHTALAWFYPDQGIAFSRCHTLCYRLNPCNYSISFPTATSREAVSCTV
jgi:hypothetical protein